MDGPIQHINTLPEFENIVLGADKQKLVVVDFFAVWCGPCNHIAPFYGQLSLKYRNVLFCKVDTDKAKAVAERCGITAMPTFQLYRAGNKIGEVKGADPKALESVIKQYQGTVVSAAYNVPGHSDLIDFIDRTQIDCLNQSTEHELQNIFKSDSSYLESDVDEQLIIVIPFTCAVKLHSLKFVAPKDKGPRTIKTFINLRTLGFDEAESSKETETLELTEEDFKESNVTNLKFVRYQFVTSIVLFVESNMEDEETTVIDQIHFIGTPIATTNIKDFNTQDQGPQK